MKKSELIGAILEVEPENKVAKSSRAGQPELTRELAAVKRRRATRERHTAVPGACVFRIESEELKSWKILLKDGRQSSLQLGKKAPHVGEVVPFDDGSAVVIGEVDDGLTITAGDLSVRDTIDSRQIYTTPNGTNVVFKRIQAGRIVLWSYKTQTEIMTGAHIELERTGRRAQPVAQKKRRMTQKILASWLISQNPSMTSSELTALMEGSFPSAQVGARHGPHYLSLSKSGKLPEAPDTDPRTWE